MIKIIKNRLFASFAMLSVAVLLIILGSILAITVVFVFIGIPLLVIGAALIVIAVFSVFFGTLGDSISFVKKLFKPKIKEKSIDVIDVKEDGGIYRRI